MIVSATVVSPCKDCTDRRLHCHAECGKYKEYKDTLERNRTAIHAQTEEANFRREVKKKILYQHEKRRKGDDR